MAEKRKIRKTTTHRCNDRRRTVQEHDDERERPTRKWVMPKFLQVSWMLAPARNSPVYMTPEGSIFLFFPFLLFLVSLWVTHHRLFCNRQPGPFPDRTQSSIKSPSQLLLFFLGHSLPRARHGYQEARRRSQTRRPPLDLTYMRLALWRYQPSTAPDSPPLCTLTQFLATPQTMH